MQKGPKPTRRKAPPKPRRAPKPFTLAHFRAWASDLILDTEESWHLEPFQEAFIEDVFLGKPECWFVVPEGNTKTTTLAGVALYHCEFKTRASVPVAAASREQAEICYRQAEGFVLRSPRMYEPMHSAIQAAKGKQKTHVPRFLCLEGYRRINHFEGGRIQVFSEDDKTGDGVIPTLGIIDEPHRQPDLSLYRTWAGKLAKRQGQIVAMSTSGELGSDFELTRRRILESATITRKGAFTRAESSRVVLHDWSLPATASPTDFKAVKSANPFSGITIPMLEEKFNAPTMTMDRWMRFTCNRPMLNIECWLGANAGTMWDALKSPAKPVPHAPTWVGVDVGLKRDSTAVVMTQRIGDKLHAWCKLWVPQSPDDPVDVTDVMQHLRSLDRLYSVMAVSYDPRFFDVPAKMLDDAGIPMVEIPQSVERMTTVCGGLLEIIKRGELRQPDDQAFTTQVLNAVPRFNEHGFTLQKSKSKGRIDACIALALAVDRAQVRAKPRPALFVGAA